MLHPQTRAVHAGRPASPASGRPLSTPVHQSSAFAFDSADALARAMAGPEGEFVYSRRGNPTVAALEAAVAGLEGGAAALATGSGMGAISAVLLSLLRPGDHVVAQRCLYGGTHAVLRDLQERFGVEVDRISGDDPAELAGVLLPETRLLLLETIANPTAQVPDLPGLMTVAGEAGVVSVVDNSLASPVLCRPIEFGADIVVHSATKYLAGHSDVIGGVVVFADRELHGEVWQRAVELGSTAAPIAAWLTLRGIQTLPLRMRQHCENAGLLAGRLSGHPEVTAVRWPLLPHHPSHETARRVLSGGGGMLSFDLAGGREAGRRFVESVRVAQLALSLGGVETLVAHPASTSHRELDAAELRAAGIGEGTVRIAVGIEHPQDLWSDIENALKLS
ncbi:PLP-dependent aspartate aminotransferase family protein [Streptomyces sodiiphilus]|uniref:PLP-dependent aspartate aminotransferase family protein n=1 Tax=Streptomyces sodiiphilus TaxID=226217 RepID=A0ABN2PP46_9ACTN